MAVRRIDPKSTALLVIDLQNDSLHPDGAYGRAGVAPQCHETLPRRLRPLSDYLNREGGWRIATHFTILSGKHGDPIVADHTRQLRPFLRKGDFLAGSWGHALVDTLPEVDLHINKYSASAFEMSPLEWSLRQIKVDTLILAGMTTPVSILTTMREALQRDFRVVVLEDGVVALDQKQNRAALAEMSGTTAVRTCTDALALME